MIVADRKVLMWRMGEQAEKMKDVSASECTSRVKNIKDQMKSDALYIYVLKL